MTALPVLMERLPFRLHDFTRTSWASARAKTVWLPRIDRIVKCRQELEWRTVAAGLQPCAARITAPDQLAGYARLMDEHGLAALPLRKVPARGAAYTSVLGEAQSAEPFNYQVVIGAAENIARFKTAWDERAEGEVRTLLGYPSCCRDFFEQVWVQDRFLDTTWPMAQNTPSGRELSHTSREIESPAVTNVLLRWLGVRCVSHLPCSFTCPATIERAEQFLALGNASGYAEEMAWLLEMLDWPVEWSALHGIAEIKTPVVKIAALSDATSTKYIVRRPGRTYPKEGVYGLAFPYRQTGKRRLTDAASYQSGPQRSKVDPEGNRAPKAADGGGLSSALPVR